MFLKELLQEPWVAFILGFIVAWIGGIIIHYQDRKALKKRWFELGVKMERAMKQLQEEEGEVIKNLLQQLPKTNSKR